MAEFVWVTWYEHTCPWISKYCDEFHTVRAKVPVVELEKWRLDR